MKKQIETKQDKQSFTRFEDLLRQVISVPKEELEKREKVDKKRREQRKANV